MNFQPYAINQSQLIGTYAPEQILRGRVLEILPDRTALVQLGAKKVVAKVAALQPPLKIDQDYLFQVEQSSNPLMVKVVGQRSEQGKSTLSMVDDALSAFQLKDEPVNRQLVQAFLDQGEPLTRSAVIAARTLISGGQTDQSSGIQAVKWMINRRLPITPALFHIAEHLMKAEPLASQLNTLNRLLGQSHSSTPATMALKEAISGLKDIKGEPPLAMAARLIGSEKSVELLKSFLQEQAPEIKPDPGELIKFVNGTMGEPDAATLLSKLHIGTKPEVFLSQFQTFLVSQSTDQPYGMILSGKSDLGLILNTLMDIGLNDEQNLRNQLASGETLKPTDSLKEKLLAVVEDPNASAAIKKIAQVAVGKITGEQIQMASSDPVVAQFSLQIPIPFQQEIKNVSVYWEGKRTKRGKLDPDSCTILLYLDLTNLKETLVSIRVQNRSVALTIQNDSARLVPLLKKGEPVLRDQLAALNYRLASVSQSERLDPQLVKKAQQPLNVSNYSLDVRI
ncbi:hypothetical protein [Sporolactobacillus pectinivorans]|uniref:hypothetical protein n=1 Tax=Sporolactobacillus pectinivorans TaxID=1591408 RepID=UPI000C26426B|nr:hypothetical protein [Sporolactobacillus pectinivorans]